MAKRFITIFITILLLTTFSCSSKKENTLSPYLESINLSTSPFTITSFDEEGIHLYKLFGPDVNDAKDEIFYKLCSLRVNEAPIPIDESTTPLYTLNMMANNQYGMSEAFSLGFMGKYINVNGKVFSFSFDIGEILEKYAYEEISANPALAVSRIAAFAPFLYDKNGFKAEWLTLSEESQRSNPDGWEVNVSMEKWKTEGKVSVSVTNNTDEEIMYDQDYYFTLITEIDGKWYDIPMNPKDGKRMDSLLIGLYIQPGETMVRDFPVSDYYQNLPKGKYRIIQVTERDGAYEFIVE